jgi:DNA polymerase III subunit alpha
MRNPFVHLHAHSEFSLLDGYGKIEDILQTAFLQGHPAHAITDHGTVSSFCKIAKLEQKKREEWGGFKPIYGVEAYMVEDWNQDEEIRPWHLTLLVQDQIGYTNLMRLVSRANIEGYYTTKRGKVIPRIDFKALESLNTGLICLSACLAGPLSVMLLQDDLEGALDRGRQLKKIFKDRFYLEVMPLISREQRKVNLGIMEVGEELGIKVVGSNDCHWLTPKEAKTHDVLCAIQTHARMSEPKRSEGGKRFALSEASHWIRTREEMEDAFDENHSDYMRESDVDRYLDCSLEIAERISYQFPEMKTRLPDFQVPNDPEFQEWRKNRGE